MIRRDSEGGQPSLRLPKPGPGVEPGVTLVAAVSGGADSVAMLHMLTECGHDVAAAHYNHGLRESADGDEEFVKSLCERWGVLFVSERGAVPKGAGVEETAREMRYAFLERARAERGFDLIATAHTADDNAETVLLNVTRGAGLHGLCGIPYRRGPIVRPLLHLSRDEVIGYLARRNIPWREDESNADTVYRRNLIRHEAVPALKRVNPSLIKAVTRLTASLLEDEEYLTGLAREELARAGGAPPGRENDTRALPPASSWFPASQLNALPRPVAARVCRLLVTAVAQYPPERVHIEAMLDIAAGGNGRRRHLAGKITVKKEGGRIVVTAEKH